jgi:hypothetical protein
MRSKHSFPYARGIRLELSAEEEEFQNHLTFWFQEDRSISGARPLRF